MRPFFDNRLESFKQGAVGILMVGGCGLSLLTAVLLVMFMMGGMGRAMVTQGHDAGVAVWIPVTFGFFCFGILMVVAGLGYGFYSQATERKGPRVAKPGKVLSRYAFTRDGQMLVSDWEVEGAENPRYYVRMDFGYPAGTMECECSEALYFQCGEGMTGTAEVQGKWLGSFIPTMGAQYTTEHVADDSHTNMHRGR